MTTVRFELIPSPATLSYHHRFAADYIRTFASQRSLNFVFGAGVSINATKKSWTDLVDSCLIEVSSRKDGSVRRMTSEFSSLLEAAQWVKDELGTAYLSAIHQSLYAEAKEYDDSLVADNNSLLFVLKCALAFGYSPEICCLNFDTFVEDYWNRRGILYNSLVGPSDSGSPGLQIWHPHGRIKRTGVEPGDWVVFTKREYEARETDPDGLNRYWREKLTGFMESRLLVMGAGGDEDVWQENIKFLISLCSDKPYSTYRGIWMLPDVAGRVPSRSVIENIAGLGFVPLRFDSLEEMHTFLDGVLEIG